jgi:ATP-dependent helicase/nuclease subunit A
LSKVHENIPDDVRDLQRVASDPGVSSWVAANAGSGKTHVLAQRVINLLLTGTDPSKILCITFTKAAAANMANRVFSRLASWIALDDEALDREIRETSRIVPDAKVRAQARRLFAAALETPGGLKVLTIHAFCTRVLHQFPFEANVAARFTVLDEPSTAQLLDRLTLEVLLEASGAPDSLLGKALEHAIVAAADQTLKDAITDAIRERELLTGWIDRAAGLDAAIAELCTALGAPASETEEKLLNAFFKESVIPQTQWSDLKALFASGTNTDKDNIERLEQAGTGALEERVDSYVEIFCKKTGLAPREHVITKKLREAHPDWLARLQQEQDRVCRFVTTRRAVSARDRTAALMTIAAEVIARYQAEKDRRGLLDYDDLIGKTRALFGNTSPSWVLYKLDAGIDHLLVDEAQDTSPRQWEIVRHLASEFTAGAGARGDKRTVFAVGDEKQSIFSFQGAAPDTFSDVRTKFQTEHDNSQRPFKPVKFETSFRSGHVVLEAVDAVFKRPEAHDGLNAVSEAPVHRALPGAAPGEVEIWQLIKADKPPGATPWTAPFDEISHDNPMSRLARDIAAAVGTHIKDGGKAGDVLVLVRQRSALFDTIIRALKDAGIAVAGADRLVLTEHIAVMDLIALADALLMPDDDLALASVLKSPLFGLTEDELLDLAWARKGSLHRALAEKAKDNARFAGILARYDRFAALALRETPFAFYARVLGAERARRDIVARLGYEATDALDEFLNLALDYETRETPSLQGFVSWLRAAKSDVKRDMEMQRDEVRVMTVHGAKGLEAPVVILADTTTQPRGPRDPKLLRLSNTGLVWGTAQDNDVGEMQDARAKARNDAEREYRRLLYVALTRAERRLIVCGFEGQKKRPAGCWYDLVADALIPLSAEEQIGERKLWRFRKGDPEKFVAEAKPAPAASVAIPNWLTDNAKPDDKAIRLISPSDSDDSEFVPHAKDNALTAAKARTRGVVIHRLLQALPDIPPDRREKQARQYLDRAAKPWTEADREAAVNGVLAILDDPRFAAAFAPGSRAEVPLIGKLPGIQLSGQIDRLVVSERDVLIVDYKTGTPKKQPHAYIRQLALYREVLTKIYPEKTVRAALIWTDVPDLVEISAADMNMSMNSLAQLTSA